MISVVAAVIEENGAFLVTRRQKGVHLAGLHLLPVTAVKVRAIGALFHREPALLTQRADVRSELGAKAPFRG